MWVLHCYMKVRGHQFLGVIFAEKDVSACRIFVQEGFGKLSWRELRHGIECRIERETCAGGSVGCVCEDGVVLHFLNHGDDDDVTAGKLEVASRCQSLDDDDNDSCESAVGWSNRKKGNDNGGSGEDEGMMSANIHEIGLGTVWQSEPQAW